MADQKISALPSATTPLTGTEVLPVVQGGATVKVSAANLTAGRAISATSIATDLGLVGTPAYAFTGDLNTGLFSPAADTIAFSKGGVEAMRISSTGNVGIGTVAPAQPLDVNGVGRFGELATKISIGVNGDTIASNADFYVRTSTANPMYFGTNSATRMTITSAGNVGIGTVAPAQPLDVNGVGRFGELATKISIGLNGDAIAADSDFYIRTTTVNAIYFGSNSITRMTVSSTGNIGIGTTAPGASAILDVQSTTQGIRMPNMTTTQKNAIASPAIGLMVFDTSLAKLCVFASGAWRTVTSV